MNGTKTLFTLSLLIGIAIASLFFIVFNFLKLFRAAIPLPHSVNDAIVFALPLIVFAIAVVNLVMTSIAWRWEGRGEPKRGVKALGWLLLVEFLLLVVLPTLGKFVISAGG